MSLEEETLIDAYNAVREGRITDPTTIRDIAKRFDAIAKNSKASQNFNIDAARAASNLFQRANSIEEARKLHFLITQEPLSARNFTLTLSALTELHTKCWLIQEGRIADLIEYTQTGNPQFEEQAGLIIAKLTYNSPALVDLLSYVLSASGVVVMVNLIDGVIQAPLRFKAKKNEIELIDKFGKRRGRKKSTSNAL